MNRKSILISVAALAIMVAGLIWAMSSLYSKGDKSSPVRSVDTPSAALLKAIPSDAAVVLYFDGSRHARRLLADSTGLLQAVIAPEGSPGLMRFLSKVGGEKTSVSLHNSGALVPLVVSEWPHADSSSLSRVLMAGKEAGLSVSFDAETGLLLSSRSETLVNTALRHLREGYSVMDSDGFTDALQRGGKDCFLMASMQYAAKLYQIYAAPGKRKNAAGARNLSRWNILSFDDIDKEKAVLSGTASTSGVNYMDVFIRQGESPVQFAEMLPYSVLSARSVHLTDISAYLEDYSRYADAVSGSRVLDDAWVKKAAVREIAVAELDFNGRTEHVMLVLPGKDLKMSKGLHPNPARNGLSSCFGDSFAAPEDSLCLSVGKWLVLGPAPVVKAYSDKQFLKYSLKSFLSDAGASLPGGSGVVSYAAAGTAFLEAGFSKPVSAAVRSYLGDSPFGPALAYAGASGGAPVCGVSLYKGKVLPDGGVAAVRDTVVVVPDGPFTVMNSATGKENKLYQNKHLSICLQDENGKDQWGVPFKERFCGRVETIDYYGNGRLQYLFAAGSKLYLIDRVGRFITGFPAELGKEVLLGPSVVDVTGERGYRAFVLHRDNTIELYNLQGQKSEGWKTMTSEDYFKDLPEEAVHSGKKYWLVRTSGGPAVYGYEGGAPLPKKEAAKILKKIKIQ